MNGLFNGIIVGIIITVVSGVIGLYATGYKIKYEYKRRLIHERTRDFLDVLKNHYMPLGYYSSLLMASSDVLASELAEGRKNDVSIKHMLFDFGNYIHRFLDTSEKLGYPIFPHYERKFKIALHHIGIVKGFYTILTPDPMTTSILRNISIKCNNNYEEFSKEIDKSEIFKKFKDYLTEDALDEISRHSYGLYETIRDSIDSALEPWYTSCFREEYEDRERGKKEFDNAIKAMFSSEKNDEGEKRSEDENLTDREE